MRAKGHETFCCFFFLTFDWTAGPVRCMCTPYNLIWSLPVPLFRLSTLTLSPSFYRHERRIKLFVAPTARVRPHHRRVSFQKLTKFFGPRRTDDSSNYGYRLLLMNVYIVRACTSGHVSNLHPVQRFKHFSSWRCHYFRLSFSNHF